MATTPESLAKKAATPEPCQVTAVAKIFPIDFFWGGGYSTQGPADAELGPSVMDLPLISVRAAGIPRASALAVTENVPLNSVLPVMAVAILCVWPAHCTPEASHVHESTSEDSPVHESAPEPPEVAASTAEPPELATYNWAIHKEINLEEANRQGKCP